MSGDGRAHCGVEGCYRRAAADDVLCAEHATLALLRAMASVHCAGTRWGEPRAAAADQQWKRCKRLRLPVPDRAIPVFSRNDLGVK